MNGLPVYAFYDSAANTSTAKLIIEAALLLPSLRLHAASFLLRPQKVSSPTIGAKNVMLPSNEVLVSIPYSLAFLNLSIAASD